MTAPQRHLSWKSRRRSCSKAYALRHLPDGGVGGRSRALLDRTGRARHHAPRRGSTLPRLARHRCAQGLYEVRIDRDFDAVIAGCAAAGARAAPRPGSTSASAGSTASSSRSAIATRSRPGCDGRLVGGLYGISAGRGLLRREHVQRASRDASKVALVHLVARLRRPAASASLDTQFTTKHLKQFGAIDIDTAPLPATCSSRPIADGGRLLPVGRAARTLRGRCLQSVSQTS